jgi:hypothetical protein
MAFSLNPKSDLLKNTGNFNMVKSPAKIAPLVAAAAGGGGAAAAGGAAAGGAAASTGDVGKIMNMVGKAKGGSSEGKPTKEKSKPKFYTEDDDSYYGE